MAGEKVKRYKKVGTRFVEDPRGTYLRMVSETGRINYVPMGSADGGAEVRPGALTQRNGDRALGEQAQAAPQPTGISAGEQYIAERNQAEVDAADARPDYGEATNTGLTARQQTISIRDPRASAGLFPAWAEHRMGASLDGQPVTTVRDVERLPYLMNPGEIARVQRGLFLSGFYGENMPRWGSWSARDQDAYKVLVSATIDYASVGNPRSMESLLSEWSQAGLQQMIQSARLEAAAASAGGGGGATVTLSDPATIAQVARSASQELLGRDLTNEEIDAVVGVVKSDEMAALSASAAAAGSGGRASAGDPYLDALIEMLTGDPLELAGEDVIMGGGPDSRAIRAGQDLADKFGLAMVRGYSPAADPTSGTEVAHEQGLAVKLGGDPGRVRLLVDWAIGLTEGATDEDKVPSEMGAGRAIRSVLYNEREGTATIVFNEGARRPDIINFASNIRTSTDAFLKAARRRDLPADENDDMQARAAGRGAHRYSWSSEPGRNGFGAYQMSERSYRAGARLMGFAEDDHSQNAQDVIARAYADHLFSKYHDWGKVALAWEGGDHMVKLYDRLNFERFVGQPARRGGGRGTLSGPAQGRQSQQAADFYRAVQLDSMGKKVQDFLARMGWESTSGGLPFDQMLADAGSQLSQYAGAGGGGGGGGTTFVTDFDARARAEQELERQNAPEAQAYGAVIAFDQFRRFLRGAGGMT